MKLTFYKRQHISQAWTFAHPWAKSNLKQCKNLRQHKCRPMLRLTRRIIVAIPCGPYFSHGAFVEFFTLSWAVERWNLSSVSLLLSPFLKSIEENMVTMILWFLNIRHSGTLFGVCFLTLAQQIFLFHPTLKSQNMWSSLVKTKDTTQVMYIDKWKDGLKRAAKFSQMILERVFEMVWWRIRKWAHTKRILKLQYFFPIKILTTPFILRDSCSFSFSFFSSLSFF
jgi:hypothetical protein